MAVFPGLSPAEVDLAGMLKIVAIIGGSTASFYRLLRGGIRPFTAAQLQFVTFAGGAVGGHFLLLFIRAAEGLRRGHHDPTSWNGVTLLGIIAGGGIAGALFLRWRRIPVGATLDLGVVPIPLGLAIGRLGCMIEGCCYGKPTDSWLGVALPGVCGLVQKRFPAQAIASGMNLAVFFALVALDHLAVRRGRLAPGSLVWAFIALHFGQRFILEWIRGTSVQFFAFLTFPQILCGVVVLFAIGALLRINRKTTAAV